MKRLLLIAIFTLLCVMLTAQSDDWLWANGAGGPSGDRGRAIASDDLGNCYVTGFFAGTSAFGGITLTSSGSDDIFVAKLDTYGNWIWAIMAGGSNVDAGYGIAIDADGNCFVTGYFQGTATFGGTSLVSSGGSDIFIAKVNTDGNWLWANKAGGSDSDVGNGISLDTDGNCYVTGNFQSTAAFGVSSLVSNGANDIFVAGMDADGNWLGITGVGGTGTDIGYGIGTDTNGNSFVTGYFQNTVTFGTTSLSSNGGSDIFIAKLDSDSDWLWAIGAGGTGSDMSNGIDTDLYGNCYATGSFSATVGFGSTTLTSSGGADIFITKVGTNGNWLWANRVGGTAADSGYGIATDVAGNIYTTGFFSGTVGFGATTLTSTGANEIYSARMDTNGNWLWANRAGGSSLDVGYGISCDASGNGYVAGVTSGAATFGNIPVQPSGVYDICIAKAGLPYPLITTNVSGTMNFGDVYLDTASPATPLWIKNTGKADLAINAINLQQLFSAFSVQPLTLPFTIAPGDSVSIDLQFTPQGLGVTTDSLFVSNNSPNHPLYALRLNGNGVYAEPMPPANVTNNLSGNDIVVTWDDVTQTVADTPIVIDYYFIYFNGSPDPLGLFYFLGRSFNTQYTHYDVVLGAEHMFYRVKAIKTNDRNVDISWIDSHIRPGMTEEEVNAILNTLK